MKRIWIGIVSAMFALTMLAFGAQKTQDVERQLKAAMNTELVDGNLKAAIEQYKKVAQSGIRPLAAQALIHMAECYQKLGDAEASKIYERVLRDYADQKEAAATARTRLASLRPAPAPAGIVTRQVWTGLKVDIGGSVSPDGRYLSFSNWETRDLGLHDFVTGESRLLTHNEPTIGPYADRSVISRDGKQVAYSWFTGRIRYELRTVSVETGAAASPRRLYNNEDVIYITPHDWFPDGNWVAVQIIRIDRTAQIGLVSSKDGSLRILKSVDWRGVTRMFFSPDGKHLAYDLSVGDSSQQRDVFVLAVDGSRETKAVVHPATDIVVGWSPDGSRLLFSSDRTGAAGLWGLAISNGRPQGAAELIKPEIGRGWSLGVTASGALYFGSIVDGPDVQVASIDFNTGQLLSPPVNPVTDYVGSNAAPQWSRDGKFLAYVSQRSFGPQGPAVIGIRSLETGQVRELRPQIVPYTTVRWSPDGRAFAVDGTDFKGRQGIFRIDAQSGEVSPIALSEPSENLGLPNWSPDGKKIYYVRGGNPAVDPAFVERDLASGAEREIIRRRPASGHLSPDGKWIVTNTIDPSRKFVSPLLVPVAGGEPRELFRVALPDRPPFSGWAADSSFVIVRKEKFGGDRASDEYWQIPVPAGAPKKLNLNLKIGNIPWISMHPDGRQVAYTTGENKADVWVMENFLPHRKGR